MNLKKHFFSTAMILVCLTAMIAQPATAPSTGEGGLDTNVIDSGLSIRNQVEEIERNGGKIIWRIIDVREEINFPFVYPYASLISIINDAIKAEEITAYSPGFEDEFQKVNSKDEINSILIKVDTIIIIDPFTYEEEVKVVRNEFNSENVKRFRVKEAWFFDEETSTMQVRIIGIAPLRSIYDDRGKFKYEQLMFWVYYPELREVLATKRTMNPLNNEIIIYWDDVFEKRYFSSYIIKESNVNDYRIQDYVAGEELLLETERVKNDLFSPNNAFEDSKGN